MRSTSPGVQAITQSGAYSASVARELMDVLGYGTPQVLTGSADPISFPGTTIFNCPGINLATLVAPLAGPQPYGDDGKTVEIFDVNGKAHVITTPANAINGNKHILTWSGAIGSNVTLQAWNGIWLVLYTPNGVTLS